MDEPDLAQFNYAYSLMKAAPKEATEILRSLAQRGSVRSMHYLGYLAANGIGMPKNVNEAKVWYDRAGRAGFLAGSIDLGKILFFEKKYDEAEELFKIGVTKEHVPSMQWLARIYMIRGVKAEETRRLLEKADAAGNLYAKRFLGRVLIRGEYGWKEKLRGIWLSISAVMNTLVLLLKDSNSERFD